MAMLELPVADALGPMATDCAFVALALFPIAKELVPLAVAEPMAILFSALALDAYTNPIE